jgi:enamine deaminase RidA (YjgF/YER057c/UK114 family)
MTKQIINPSPMASPTGYSHVARKSGTPVFISGQVALDGGGNVVGKGDPAAQAAQIFANLRTVVEAAGGTMDDIVKLNVYALDVGYRPVIAEARAAAFPDGQFPASTFVVISGLAAPDFLIEIEAVAMIDG